MNNVKNELYNNIVMGNYEIESINECLQSDNAIDCYLALVSALKRDVYTAQQHLMRVRETELSEMDCLVCLEAKVVISYLCGNFSEVEKHAAEALALSDRVFFARSLLARVFSWKKRFHEAIEHYKILLETYPFHSSTLLDLAECMLYSKGNYQEMLNYVVRAKKSFRRNMYLILMPLRKPFARLLLALTTLGLFSIPQIGTFLFGLFSMLIVLAGIVTLIKTGLDFLIMTGLFILQVVITFMWLLTWIFSNW